MKKNTVLVVSAALLLTMVLANTLVAEHEHKGKPSSAEVMQKTQKLQMPFVANEGQLDERVAFYARTFGGTVFVTKDGEIVYALPGGRPEDASSPLKVGRSEHRGELRSPNRVSPLKRGDQGVCNTITIPHNTKGTPLQALFIEGSNKDSYTGYMMHDQAKGSPITTSCILHRPWYSLYPGCIWDFLGEDYQQSSIINPNSGIQNPASVNSISPNPKSAIQNLKSGIALKEEFIGAKISGIKGEGESVTKVSYFKGNDPSKWKGNISTYELVNLGEIYDGIELKLKAHGNNVEKLLYVKPGAVPEQIKISLSGIQSSVNPPPLSPSVRGTAVCPPLAGAGGGAGIRGGTATKSLVAKDIQNSPLTKGARGLSVNEHGELVAETELGPVKFTKPIAYQIIDGKRVEIECGYVISDYGIHESSDVGWVKRSSPNKNGLNGLNPLNSLDGFASLNPSYPWQLLAFNSQLTTSNSQSAYSFTVASYDRTKDLVIDPLLASTYLGGSGYDESFSLALDTSGNVYVAGSTSSSDFPTTSGAYDTYWNGVGGDVFVSKLDSGVTSLLASTYLGGSGGEVVYSLALDTSGNVYVAGSTSSSDFPTTSGAYDTYWNGAYADVFVSKLDGGLTSLLTSTYLGGSSDDWGYSLAQDTGGNVYVAGRTVSSDFPTTSGAYDASYNGGYEDVFISKLDSGLTSLLASTYLGGSGYDFGYSLTLDTGGNVYVAGLTSSTDFPTTSGAYDTYWNGADADVFVSKLDSGLTSLLTSTYLGGSSSEEGCSLTLDTSGNVYITGYTVSTNFPTTVGAYDTSLNGTGDAFISKLDGGLTSLLASTHLGGAISPYGQDYGFSLALDTSGNVYVMGFTYSTDFPTTSGAHDTSFNGGYRDVFISKLNSGLTSLLASTYLGGSGGDGGYSLTLDTSGNVYVAGSTSSSDFPTTGGAYDTSFYGSYYDVFISKLDGNLSASAATTPTPTPSPSPSPTPTITPEVDPLLEKYAPILYIHSKERFHPTNVKVMLDNSELYEKKCKKEGKTGACKKYEGAQVLDNKDKKLTLAQLMNEYNDNVYYLQLKKEAKKKVKKDWKERQTVYARQTKDTNEDGKEKTILQYWFFYVYNDWGTSDKLGNTHEGDWEMIQIELGENKQPERISFSYHHGGVTFGWDDKDEDNKDKVSKDGNHPHVYVTLGGHGCWNSPDDHTWYQRKALDCWKCTDKTDRYGDVLHPNSMSDSEISEIQSSSKKYPYAIEEMTYWTDKDKEWIYWEGYWGQQTKSKMNGREDFGLSGPQSPPHIDYINEVKAGEKSQEGRWHKPLKWANAPLPSEYYEVCNSKNSKVVANYLESNSGKYSDYCNWTSDLLSCDDVCSNLRIIYSEEDVVFDVFSLDGKEVDLKISRYKRTGELYEVEFEGLEIPKNGKASFTFSPEQNPSLEIEIDHDMDGLFDSHRLPDHFEIK